MDWHVGRRAPDDALATHNPIHIEVKLCSQCSRCSPRPHGPRTFPDLRRVANCGDGKQSAEALLQGQAGPAEQHEDAGHLRRRRVRGLPQLEPVGGRRT